MSCVRRVPPRKAVLCEGSPLGGLIVCPYSKIQVRAAAQSMFKSSRNFTAANLGVRLASSIFSPATTKIERARSIRWLGPASAVALPRRDRGGDRVSGDECPKFGPRIVER